MDETFIYSTSQGHPYATCSAIPPLRPAPFFAKVSASVRFFTSECVTRMCKFCNASSSLATFPRLLKLLLKCSRNQGTPPNISKLHLWVQQRGCRRVASLHRYSATNMPRALDGCWDDGKEQHGQGHRVTLNGNTAVAGR